MNMQNLLQVSVLLQITPGRLTSIVAGLVGLASVIIGLALARSVRRSISFRRSAAIVALVAGLIGAFLSVLHLVRTTGGFGTGKGRAGAIVALVIGLTGMVLGWRALVRSRRIVTNGNQSQKV
jgi:hypothetical protein